MDNSLCIPKSATWEVLRNSRNHAVVRTLATGLSSTRPEIRLKSLEALAARSETSAATALVQHWEKYDDRDLKFLRVHGDKLAKSCQSLITTGSPTEQRFALAAIAALGITNAIGGVLELVLQRKHPLNQQAIDCMMGLCDRSGQLARNNQDLPSRRDVLRETLFNALVMFHEHKSQAVVDAWLVLAHWDDSEQRGLISDPRMDAYPVVMRRLAESKHPSVLQLLAGYLGRSTTPKRVIEIAQQRTELELLIEAARRLTDDELGPVLRHLRRLPMFVCLKQWDGNLEKTPFDVARRFWLLAAASSEDHQLVLSGAIRLSMNGTVEGRKVAAEILKNCRPLKLEDSVAALQEGLVDGLGEGLGQTLQQVAQWCTSPSLVLKRAALEFFREFTLDGLLNQIRIWPTQMCKAMAQLVKSLDDAIPEALERHLDSPAPKRRIAALQAAQMLECAEEITNSLLPLLEDSNLEVRVRTIDLLAAMGYAPLESMIPTLLNDASTDIQDAANRAIRKLHRARNQPSVAKS